MISLTVVLILILIATICDELGCLIFLILLISACSIGATKTVEKVAKVESMVRS